MTVAVAGSRCDGPEEETKVQEAVSRTMVDFMQMKSFSEDPLVLTSGEGIRVVDVEGRRYIDGLSGTFCAALGHGNGELADAGAAQLHRLAMAAPTMATNDRALELIDELLRQKEMWKRPRKLFVWSVSRGFVDMQGHPAAKEDTRRPERALAFVAAYPEGALFLFKDFHPYLKDNAPDAALLIRLLRDLVPDWRHPVTGETVDELIAALDAARGTATRAFPQKAILTPRQQSSMLLQRCRRSPISRTIAPTSL